MRPQALVCDATFMKFIEFCRKVIPPLRNPHSSFLNLRCHLIKPTYTVVPQLWDTHSYEKKSFLRLI